MRNKNKQNHHKTLRLYMVLKKYCSRCWPISAGPLVAGAGGAFSVEDTSVLLDAMEGAPSARGGGK